MENQTSASARRISAIQVVEGGGLQLKLCATPRPFFKGTISVAYSMLLHSRDREWYLRQASKYNFGLM